MRFRRWTTTSWRAALETTLLDTGIRQVPNSFFVRREPIAGRERTLFVKCPFLNRAFVKGCAVDSPAFPHLHG